MNILAQRVENSQTDYDSDVWVRFSRKINENREVKDITADEVNILICRRFHDEHKKERWRRVRANNFRFVRFLPFFSRKKKLFNGLCRSVLEETVSEVLSTPRGRHL